MFFNKFFLGKYKIWWGGGRFYVPVSATNIIEGIHFISLLMFFNNQKTTYLSENTNIKHKNHHHQ